MTFICEPSLYYLSEEEWEDEEKKDCFLEKFNNCLNLLNIDEDNEILWSDELETLLWESPQHPPWRSNKDFMNQQINYIIKSFSHKCSIIDTSHEYYDCNFDPNINYDEKYDCAFKNLSSKLVKDDINANLILGINQLKRKNTNITCSPQTKTLSFLSINNVADFLKNDDNINNFWPSRIDDKQRFTQYIKLLLNNTFKNNFIFENNFIRDLINEKELRFKIKTIETILKRLNLNTIEAKNDSIIQEEKIDDFFRIRVTPRPTSVRIHLKVNGNTIIFNNYYSSGEHDDGL